MVVVAMVVMMTACGVGGRDGTGKDQERNGG
jgi:hypothetical protein